MKKNLNSNLFILILLVFILLFSLSVNGFAKDRQTLAILPFEMISPEDISYIQSGIQQMLYSRLEWKNHVHIIQKSVIAAHLTAIEQQNKNMVIKKMAELTDSDYVLTGSITEFSNAFSIDVKIYDIKNRQFLPFSEQSKKIDDIIPKLNVITAKINKKVFDRHTIVYEDLVRAQKEKLEQWKRQNPEKMMPTIPSGEQEEKSSFWRFWEYL